MRLLLDTHVLLWAAQNSPRLSSRTRKLLNDVQTQPIFSVASLWEITIKNGLGRADFRVNIHVLRRGLLENGYSELTIQSEHILSLASLPLRHKDPFDRVLIAQAMHEGIHLLTADAQIAQYRPCGVTVIAA